MKKFLKTTPDAVKDAGLSDNGIKIIKGQEVPPVAPAEPSAPSSVPAAAPKTPSIPTGEVTVTETVSAKAPLKYVDAPLIADVHNGAVLTLGG